MVQTVGIVPNGNYFMPQDASTLWPIGGGQRGSYSRGVYVIELMEWVALVHQLYPTSLRVGGMGISLVFLMTCKVARKTWDQGVRGPHREHGLLECTK